jgi:alkylation response protein AidB-like acyl-CoA dehydrogenase
MTLAPAPPTEARPDELRDEVRSWVAATWSLESTGREWWRRLAGAGLSAPSWPAPFGRGYSGGQARIVTEELAAAGAIAAPQGGVGLMLGGPTVLDHGSEEQRNRLLPPLLRGEEAWCQLFSEPGAGSDLAGLATRAVPDGDGWVVNGQKVWTSGGQYADRGMLLARTDPDAPKHRGITYFAFDMRQPGVEPGAQERQRFLRSRVVLGQEGLHLLSNVHQSVSFIASRPASSNGWIRSPIPS